MTTNHHNLSTKVLLMLLLLATTDRGRRITSGGISSPHRGRDVRRHSAAQRGEATIGWRRAIGSNWSRREHSTIIRGGNGGLSLTLTALEAPHRSLNELIVRIGRWEAPVATVRFIARVSGGLRRLPRCFVRSPESHPARHAVAFLSMLWSRGDKIGIDWLVCEGDLSWGVFLFSLSERDDGNAMKPHQQKTSGRVNVWDCFGRKRSVRDAMGTLTHRPQDSSPLVPEPDLVSGRQRANTPTPPGVSHRSLSRRELWGQSHDEELENGSWGERWREGAKQRREEIENTFSDSKIGNKKYDAEDKI